MSIDLPYADFRTSQPIDLQRQGCPIAVWQHPPEGAKCAIHTAGFPIFLSHARLADGDEYADGDPYTVDENLSHPFHQRRIRCTVDAARKALAGIVGPSRLLDVACGTGFITAELAKAFPQTRVLAFDYSVRAIDTAHSRYSNIEFAVADVYEPPYAESQFDLIVLNNIWEHVPDPLRLLSIVKKLLKRDGSIVISTPSRYHYRNLIRILRGQRVHFMSNLHVTEYTVGQVKEQLAYSGFAVVSAGAPAIPEESKSHTIIKALLSRILRIFGSHHVLEMTVFYVARLQSKSVQSGHEKLR